MIPKSLFYLRSLLVGLFLYSFAQYSVYAQMTNSSVDSLHTLLQKSQPDTHRVNILNELAWEYRKADPKQGVRHAQSALDLSKKLNFKMGLATSYIRLGFCYQNQGNPSEALKNYQSALEVEKSLGHAYGIARSQNYIGLIYDHLGQCEKAIALWEQALATFERLDETAALTAVANNLASCYSDIGQQDKALELHLNTLERKRKIGNQENIAASLLDIGWFYNKNKNYDSALDYYQQAAEIYKKTPNKVDLSKIYQNIGSVYQKLNQHDKALESYHKSLKIKQEIDSEQGLAKLFNNIGHTHYSKKEIVKAEEYFQKAVQIAEENDEKNTLAETYNNLGLLYLDQGSNQRALKHYQKSLEIAEKINNAESQQISLRNLALGYTKVGDSQKALEYSKRYLALSDSLEQSYRSAMNYKDAYEEQQKQQELLEKDRLIEQAELARLAADNRQQMTLIYALIAGTMLLTGLFLALIQSYQGRQKRLIAENKLKDKQYEVEEILSKQQYETMSAIMEGQELERNRIAQELHDNLGSMLSMVKLHFKSVNEQLQNIADQNQETYEKAFNLLDKTSEEVRRISHDLSSNFIERFGLSTALQELKKTVESSQMIEVDLVEVGMEGKRLNVKLELIIYRTVQELVSNVLKHAEATDLEIQVFCRDEEGELTVTVVDNGKGFDREQVKESKSLGLDSIDKRITQLGGHFHVDTSLGKGTTAIIHLPLSRSK